VMASRLASTPRRLKVSVIGPSMRAPRRFVNRRRNSVAIEALSLE